MSYQDDVQQYNFKETKEDPSCSSDLQKEEMRKLFVGGLKRDTDEKTFNEYFAQFGDIVDNVIIKDMNTNESRGFGFITYGNSDSIQVVLSGKPHEIGGKQIDVKRAMPKDFDAAGHSKTNRLFIGGFKGSDIEPDNLREYLEFRHPTKFGSIESIDFLKDKETNVYKGFGFIDCSDTDFADRIAIAECSFTLKGRNMSIKKAQPKGGQGGTRGGGGRGGGRGRGFSRGGRGRGGGSNSNANYGGGNSGGGDYTNQGSYGGGNQGGYAGGNQGGYAGGNQGGFYNQHGGGGGRYNQSQGYDQSNAYSGYGQQQQGGGYGQQQQQGGGYNQSSYGSGRGGGQDSGRGNSRYQPY